MCVLHGAGNLQANLHLTHGVPRLASSPHLTSHNPHPPCCPEKEEEVVPPKALPCGLQACDCLAGRELSQGCTTSPPGGNSGIPGLRWWCDLTCEGVTAGRKRELSWAVLIPPSGVVTAVPSLLELPFAMLGAGWQPRAPWRFPSWDPVR